MARTGKKKESKIEWCYMLPIIIVLVLVPLIVHAHTYVATADFRVYGGEGEQTALDFISYYKSVVLLIGAGAMLALMVFRWLLGDRQPQDPAGEKGKIAGIAVWCPLFVYALFVFLSACFSDYKDYAFHGMDGMYESVWVVLAYCLTAVYTYWMLDEESKVSKLLAIFKIGMSLLCFYGVIELLFGNPLGWESIKYLIYTQEQLANYGSNWEFSTEGLVMTFYNSNYVASLLACTIPISLMAIFMEEKKGNKIWFGILFFLEWVMLIACRARSGLPAVLLSLLIVGFFLRKRILKQKKWILVGLAVVIVGYLTVEIPGGFSYSKRFTTLFTMEAEEADLERIETLADSVEITYAGNTLSLTYAGYDKEKPFVAMCDGQEVVYEKNEKIWETKDSRFTQIQLAVTGNEQLDYFDVGIEGQGWRFINIGGEGGYYYINPARHMVKMGEAKKAFSRKYWRFGSSRGYVWAKAIPLLKDYIVLGSGPDTFYMVYPWNDYVDQASVMAKEKIFKRPHSMYLQMGIQTGGISLLAFLAFAGWYAAASLKLYGKKRAEEFTGLELFGMGVFAGVLGYLIVGLVNDSMVGIAQYFWCFIGVGLAVNRMVKKNRKKA